MLRDKPRPYLALYARPKHPGAPHYALFVAPKSIEGSITKHHVKNTLQIDDSGQATQPWRYEWTMLSDITAEHRLLVRVIIAKVTKSCDHVQRILESVPVYQVDDPDTAKAQSFRCRTWVRDAFQELRGQGAIASELEEWEAVQRNALEYLDRKQEQGRWDSAWKGGSGVPLMDLLEGKKFVE